MKIESVTTVVINARLRNWVFVKVATDMPGLIGWGEATLEWKARAVAAAVEDLAQLIVGEDPRRIEHVWQSMYRRHFFRGGAVTMSALSGIDQALWDIKAKDLGVPCWQLMGGSVREFVRMYDHLGGGDSTAVYGTATTEGFAEAAMKSVADGFTAVKILAVPVGAALPDSADVRKAADLLGAVRAAAGDLTEVMVDFHGRTTAAGAVQYIRAFEEFWPWFVEEPCLPGNPAEMARIAAKVSTPLATGERLLALEEFREHLAVGACAVLQPDVCHVGGPTGLRRIAAIAESHQISLAPHNPLGPIATIVNQHIGFATPNFLIQEVMRSDVPWRDDVVTGTLPIVKGMVRLPNRPGWGIEVDEQAAQNHPYSPEPQIMMALRDDAVGDW